jgi:transcriptional regulator with XRE-family HTH domain
MVLLGNNGGKIGKQTKENATNMTPDTSKGFGNYLQSLRQQRRLGLRELARQADVNPSALTRLEQGKTSPMPETLRALAPVLEVPTSELFAAAGYMVPSELPHMSTYLRVCYGDVSDETVVLIEAYIQRLVNEQGLDPNGPADAEDEAEKLPRE